MIDIKALEKNEENPFLKMTFVEGYRKSLNDRGLNGDEIVSGLLESNKLRRSLINESETAKSKQNKVSGEIAKLKREGKDATDLLREMQKLSDEIKSMEARTAEADEKVQQQLLVLPNILHHTVPVGSSAEQNRIEKTVGTPTKLAFKAKDHIEIGEKLDLLDFERGGKVTGARFTFLKKGAARLERALIQFMMDLHSEKHGYDEMIPPFIVNSKSLVGTNQFPKFKEDVFGLVGHDYYLIPTAEVPVTNYHAEEILEASMLPKCFVAYSPCFRSEAGSYGKDTKGLIRQHQFNKVELVKFTRPEESEAEHEKLTTNAEAVLEQLELPYRRMALCSGDIGFGAMKCYDLEVWLPGQHAYREISSCSNFGDFQARRANIRFRDGAKGKPQFVHTINGSGLAVGRTLIAIFENFQQEDGSVVIPKALRPYTKIDVIKS